MRMYRMIHKEKKCSLVNMIFLHILPFSKETYSSYRLRDDQVIKVRIYEPKHRETHIILSQVNIRTKYHSQ